MAKKSFRDKLEDNPALQFITQPEHPQETAADSPQPEGYYLNPKYIEKRTKRLQLVLTPSLYRAMRESAEREGISVNELVHRVLSKELKGDADDDR